MSERVTPSNITELQPGEVFVYGSNLFGWHYGGAAKTAYEKFGAEWGVGHGMTGQCYAFPTVAGPDTLGMAVRLRPENLAAERDELFFTANSNPQLTFLLTRIGCGVAGGTDEEVSRLFTESPSNIIKPMGW